MNIFAAAANAVLLHAGGALGAVFRQNYHANAMRGRRVSEKRLRRILQASRNTEYGKKYGFASIRNARDYQNAVPLSTYEDYRPYIERTAKTNEQGLITGHRINYFATTSGTMGAMKLIPQIAATYIPYFKFICIAANELVTAMRKRGVNSFSARGLLVTEIETKPVDQYLEDGGKIPTGVISAYGAGGVKAILPLFTPTPAEVYGTDEIGDMKYIKARYGIADPDLKWFGGIFMSGLPDIITYIETNSELLIHDIETGTISPSVKMTENMRARLTKKLRPDPRRASELRRIFNTPSDIPLIMRIWPKMSFVCSIGTGDFELFTRKMRSYCSEDVFFHFLMYASSESPIGIALHSEEMYYLLLAEAGFFEFLPIEKDSEDAEARPLLLDELEEGKHYEIIVTNLAGLYRYRLRDVVRVRNYVGEVPCIEFAYRANNVTDLCGSHVTGEEILAAVEETEKVTGIRVEDFMLYADSDHYLPRLELFLEPERLISADEQARMGQTFEETLRHIAWDYDFCRKGGGMDEAAFCTVAPGTFMRYRDMRIAAGASVNQLKTVRIIDNPEKLDFFRAAVTNTNSGK